MKAIKIENSVIKETSLCVLESSDKFQKLTIKLMKALADVQYLSRTRTINEYDIISAVDEINEHFKGISKKALEGCRVMYDKNASKFLNSYMRASKGNPQSTVVVYEHDGRNWNVIDICRGDCNIKGEKFHVIHTTEILRKAIIEKERIF